MNPIIPPSSIYEKSRRTRSMGWEGKALLITFSAGFLVRMAILSSYPSFVGTGDSAQWITFSREIIENNFLLPHVNTLHYPGSLWVYPPIIPYFLAVLMSAFSLAGWQPFYVVSFLLTLLQSLGIVPIFFILKRIFDARGGIIASLVYMTYPPMLYLISWGALPQVTSFLILALILWEFTILSREKRTVKRLLVIGFLSAILAFTHGLTSFYLFAVLVLYLPLLVLWRLYDEKKSHGGIISGVCISLATLATTMVLLYVPKITYLNNASGNLLTDAYLHFRINILTADAANLSQPLAIPSSMWYLSLVFPVMMVLVTFYYYGKERKLLSEPVIAFLILSIPLCILTLPSPTLFVRISYFLLFLYIFPASYFLRRIAPRFKTSNLKRTILSRSFSKKKLPVLLVTLIVLYSTWGIAFNYSAHSYFLGYSGNQSPSYMETVQWISENVQQNRVVAANASVGFLVMGYDGNPVLINQAPEMLTQKLELIESYAAGTLVYHPYVNLSKTLSVIEKYNVSIVISPLNDEEVPSFYSLLYNNDFIYVYNV